MLNRRQQKLIVKEEQGQRLTLSAFGTTLQQIYMAGAITQEVLLQSPTIDVLKKTTSSLALQDTCKTTIIYLTCSNIDQLSSRVLL